MALPNEEQLARLTEQVNEEFRTLGHVTPATSKAMMEAQTQIANFNFKVELGTKFLGKLADAAIGTQKAMYKGEKGASAFNKSIDDMSDAAQIAAVGLSLLIPGGPLMKAAVAGITYLATSAMKAGAELTKTANEQSDTLYNAFQKLSKAGAAGSDGMTGVFGDIQKLGLGIQDLDGYISLINDSSRDLALFGGSVTSGRKAFADMNSEMKPFTEQLYNAGLNQEDIAKGAMSYLKIQTQLGAAQTMTSKQLADGAKKYLIEQDALTKLTGMTRADAEAAREAAMSEQRFAAKIAAMKRSSDPKERAAAEELIKANQILESQSKEAAQGFRDLSTGMITTDASQKALVSSNGEALTQATAIASGNATAIEGVQKMGTAFGKFAEDMNATAQAGVFEDFSIKFADAVKLGIFAAGDLEKEYKKINEDIVAQGVTGQKARDALQQTQTEIRLVQKESMLATQGFVQTLVGPATDAMLTLAKAANSASQALLKMQTPSAQEASKLSGTEGDIYTGGAMSEEARGGEVKYPSTPAGTKPTAATVPLNAQGKPMTLMEQAQASSEAAKANNAQRQAAPAPAAPAPAAPAPAKPAPAAPAAPAPAAPAPSSGGGSEKVIPTTPSAPPGTPAAGGNKPSTAPSPAPAPAPAKTENKTNKPGNEKGNEKGVKPEVLSKKAQLEETIGKNLLVTSGVRPGTANHGDGSAIDIGLNSNNLSEAQRNKLLEKAISLGFTGLGAEYRAKGGPHIHLDTAHSNLTGWGSDYTSASLKEDSPFLANLIGSKSKNTESGPASASASLVDFIKGFEKFSPMAHQDFKQISIGYGTKAKSENEGPITEAEAESRLLQSLSGASGYVTNFQKKNPKYKWGQPQIDALSSFAYNGGNGWIDQVTDNGKRSNAEILKMMTEYNKAGGKVAGGLVSRRAAEAAMFGQNLQAADGGVFDGPKSGYAATLHGNEAVIPLKDGAVPVSMSQEFNMTAVNLGELVNQMKYNMAVQDRMVAVLEEIRRSQVATADNTGRMVAYASN